MRRLITLMLAAAVLAGCSFSTSSGDSPTIDPAEFEGDISTQMTKQHPDIPVNSVTCPDGIKPAQGVTFECTAQLEGVQLPIKVTITQVDLGKGTYDYDMKPTKNVLIPEGIVNALKRGLREQGVQDAKVDCGTERFRVVEVGGAIECIVSAGGERRVVRAVADEGGGVHFEDG